MSDMLQLVVRVGHFQFVTSKQYHWLSIVNLADKLKHIGQIFDNRVEGYKVRSRNFLASVLRIIGGSPARESRRKAISVQ